MIKEALLLKKSKIEKTKTDDKTGGRGVGDEQPDTTDMSDLESEESVEQRKIKKKIKNINSRTMVSRLPTTNFFNSVKSRK